MLAGGATAVGLAGATPAAASSRGRRRIPRVVRLWEQAWNTGNADLMASLFTTDGSYTDHAFQATFTGRDGIRQWVAITLDSITDARAAVDDAVQDGDRVMASWTFTGTFTTVQPFTEGDPRGRSFSVPAVSSFALAGSRIRSVADYYNLADLMRQLGLPVAYTPPTA